MPRAGRSRALACLCLLLTDFAASVGVSAETPASFHSGTTPTRTRANSKEGSLLFRALLQNGTTNTNTSFELEALVVLASSIESSEAVELRPHASIRPRFACRDHVCAADARDAEPRFEVVFELNARAGSSGALAAWAWAAYPKERVCRFVASEDVKALSVALANRTALADNRTSVDAAAERRLRAALSAAPSSWTSETQESSVSVSDIRHNITKFTCKLPSNVSDFPALALVRVGEAINCTTKCDAMVVNLQASSQLVLERYHPKTGPTTGGTTVALQGSGLTSDMWCEFRNSTAHNSTLVPVKYHNSTFVECEAPPGVQGRTALQLRSLQHPGHSHELEFTYYDIPQVKQVEPNFISRFGEIVLSVQATGLDALRELGSDAELKCQLVASNTGGAVEALLLGEFSPEHVDTILCRVKATSSPIPSGSYHVELSFNGQQFGGGESVAANSVMMVGPSVFMTSTQEVVSNEAEYIAIGVELKDNYGISSVDAHVTINITTDSAYTSGADFPLFVLAATKNYSDHQNARPVVNNTLMWGAGELGVQYALILLNTSNAKELTLTVNLEAATNADLDSSRLTTEVLVGQPHLPPLFAAETHTPIYRSNVSQVVLKVNRIQGDNMHQAVIAYSAHNTTEVPEGSIWPSHGVLVWEKGDSPSKEIILYVSWDRIPLNAEYPIGVSLQEVAHARVVSGIAQVLQAAVLFGVPEGSCPPGARRSNATQSIAPLSSPSTTPENLAGRTLNALILRDSQQNPIPITPRFEPTVFTYSAVVDAGHSRVSFACLPAEDRNILSLHAGSLPSNPPISPITPFPPSPSTSQSLLPNFESPGPPSLPELPRRRTLLGETPYASEDVRYETLEMEDGSTLTTGSNQFWVVSTLPDMEDKIVYQITITKLSPKEDVQLRSLSLRDEHGSLLDLDPTFDPDTYYYTAALLDNVTSLMISSRCQAEGCNAILKEPSGSYLPNELLTGVNIPVDELHETCEETIIVSVFAGDNTTEQTYTIDLLCKASSPLSSPPLSSPPHLASPPGRSDIQSHSGLLGRPPISPPPRHMPPAPPFYAALSPFSQSFCEACPPGFISTVMDAVQCNACPPGSSSTSFRSDTCTLCEAGQYASKPGSSVCSLCPMGSHSALNGSRLCLLCPSGLTSSADGLATCDMVLDANRLKSVYAILVEFQLQLGLNVSGNLNWDSLPDLVGFRGATVGILAQLIRMDTADAFNITANNVTVNIITVREMIEGLPINRTHDGYFGMPARIEHRMLLVDANVSAILEAKIPANANKSEVAMALAEKEVSADKGIQLLSENPDLFFGRTTSSLGAKASTVGNVTSNVVTPEENGDDSDFWDDDANIVGLALGIFGGLVLTSFFVKRVRLKRRAALYASVYGPSSMSGSEATTNPLLMDVIAGVVSSQWRASLGLSSSSYRRKSMSTETTL